MLRPAEAVVRRGSKDGWIKRFSGETPLPPYFQRRDAVATLFQRRDAVATLTRGSYVAGLRKNRLLFFYLSFLL